MNILGIETSNLYPSVAISKNGIEIFAKKDYRQNSQAENLIPLIEEALEKTRLQYSDLDFVAASVGPGSFTGIRIGVAAARAIAISVPSVKTICVNNFETINFRIGQQVTKYDVAISCINAYRGEVYMQFFCKEGTAICHPSLEKIEAAATKINVLKGKIAISGSGINKLFLPNNFGENTPEYIATKNSAELAALTYLNRNALNIPNDHSLSRIDRISSRSIGTEQILQKIPVAKYASSNKSLEDFDPQILSALGPEAIHGPQTNGLVILPRFVNPDARIVCRVAREKVLSGLYNQNLDPLYIREPDAKVNYTNPYK
ncbi:MAG: tRNA (adenosine(37)-N6)-threonylcarbamoyltransferase complex dimerization subunit type 1 TsaB [Rickettsiaceae bacterium]|nr:tRNA (adenosine(37)-N6)-threonylcarbamoyltransferase complex dimerization subunit type 1 TsaB [Rickettsiaceae bacterium]